MDLRGSEEPFGGRDEPKKRAFRSEQRGKISPWYTPAAKSTTLLPMNPRLQYELRGWAYWARCANPFRDTIAIRDLPLGLTLRAYKRDAVGRGLFRRKIHEPALTKFLLERFAGPGERRFIDVGANLGYFTCLLGKLAGPGGKVLAVEPEPRNLRLLRENVAINSLANIEIQSCAVGSAEGSVTLALYRGANLGRHSVVDVATENRIEVPATTLDALTGKFARGVSSWSFVKIDVEGYEGFVIDGAKETLARADALFVEFSPSLQRKAGGNPVTTLRTLGAYFTRAYRMEGAEFVERPLESCLRGDESVELIFER